MITGHVWGAIFTLNFSRFSDTQSIEAIKSKAESLPHIQGGTRTDRALELAAEDFFGWEDSGDRPDKPNVLIVLTDGDTNEGSKPFSQVIPPLDVSHCQQTFLFIVFWLMFLLQFTKVQQKANTTKSHQREAGSYESFQKREIVFYRISILKLYVKDTGIICRASMCWKSSENTMLDVRYIFSLEYGETAKWVRERSDRKCYLTFYV